MAWWRVTYILAVLVRLAQPRCFICQHDCQDLPSTLQDFNKVFVSCEEANHQNLETFVESNNFTSIRSLTLKSPMINSLNLSKFFNISTLDFSENNITNLQLNNSYNTVFFNLSNNFLKTFEGLFPKLIHLDLSNNFLKNVSKNILESKKLIQLNLQHNNIQNISNFYSSTLKYLDVRNNKIKIFQLQKCPNLREIDASSNLIEKLYVNLSAVIPNIEVLNLSSNVIQELKDYNLNLTNLLKLDLRNNKIKTLSQKCFYGLNKLQYLDISLNKIQTVSPSTFQYLIGLIQLIVSENRDMNSQDFGLLLATRRLKSVYASKTNQKKIPSSLTRSVRYLVLSFNNISQIQCGDLDSYPLLNSLDLANNNISYIEDDALGRLDFLVTLNINDNFLSIVPHTLPNNLKELFLKNNKIKSINSNDFTELQQLNQLDLSFNEIKVIKDDSFSQLFNLEKLNLSGNHINSLPTNSFGAPRKLKVLDLSYLLNLTKCEQTLCFPVPEYNNIRELHMQNSPTLVSRFMKDVAALKTFKQLAVLNIANANITSIRKDLPTYLPRLNELDIHGNKINCSLIKDIFVWFLLNEINNCVFIITEDHSKDQPHADASTVLMSIQKKITTVNFNFSSSTPQIPQNESVVVTTEYVLYENKSELELPSIETDFLSNEAWYKNESPGIVDAYSAETPTSHPGLFVLLLLPIALVSTCLFINYSRIKKQRHNLIHSEMDIEISNISSELW